MPKATPKPDDYIEPLNMNGLEGRMLHIPAHGRKNREILMLYGHHALLERWWGLAQNCADFGSVTMPDLPGFGGMDSFYKIGQTATLDNYADYLASFIKMRYKRRRISILAISFGFLVATRMLQRYPGLAKQVDFLVSAAGFMRADDFIFSRRRYLAFLYGAKFLAIPPLPIAFRHLALNATVLRMAYAKTPNAKHKFAQADGDTTKFDRMMDMEIQLWQKNDVRTYMRTTVELMTVDNCKTPINLPVWHIYTLNDHFFDHRIVEQHMRVVFSDFHGLPIKLRSHTVSVLADKAEAAGLIPQALRRALRQTTSR
ncbi:MAG TPA: alpha/beta hydrolase [Candidatus Saccharimonadales bacterium]|nr:alpha/beta hydrolase [Candidatus Saccharimonadales bacterium]